jgi:Fe-Mn family superoxide dismutase
VHHYTLFDNNFKIPEENKMNATLPNLEYEYDALEPYYDKQTLEIHHTKHHAGYVKGFNNALSKLQEARETGEFALVKHWQRELAFHGAGHLMHSLFWKNMRAGKEDNKPTDSFLEEINKSFGSFEKFQAHFKKATASVEGSGWGMLAKCPHGSLKIFAVENHQKQLAPGFKPLLVCDVWEHAYYLKYQNRRVEWIDNFFKIINWEAVEKRFSS